MKVRKDVVVKLITGLKKSREFALEKGASYPKTYHYSTNRADNYIYDDGNKYYCTSLYYDGTKCNVTINKDGEV